MARIPQLVFATRSPEPKSGSDFVRQIVAEQGEVTEEARKEFARRADIAGSVLQMRRDDSSDGLRVFTFNRFDKHTWLFSRAISLGIYRKGSHQLLVHGVLLSEEVLDWLGGNPFALDTPSLAELGFRFLDHHPGQRQMLDSLTLDDRVATYAREHNRDRLARIREADDAWLAAAYDALAVDARAACIARDPRPETIENLLLHFHPDDRMELSFHTFYTHSRPVDYRLLGVLPSDLSAIRRQFRDLETVDLGAATPEPRGLGMAACRGRRQHTREYVDLIEEVRLTYLSHRRLPPISLQNAAFALERGMPGGMGPSAIEQRRLDELRLRSGGGLGYRIRDLAARWREPARFDRAVDAAERAELKIGRVELDRFLDENLPLRDHSVELPPDLEDERRWALTALLSSGKALVPGAADERERWQMVRRILPPARLQALTDGFSADQASTAYHILRRLAVADATYGGLTDDADAYWPAFLIWLRDRGQRLGNGLDMVENALKSRPAAESGPSMWFRLRDVCRNLGEEEEAFRLFLSRGLPLLEPMAAQRAVTDEVELLLRERPEKLVALAASFGQPGVAEATFRCLADRLAGRPDDGVELWGHFRRSMEAANRLDLGAARELGRLLGELTLLPATSRANVPWAVDRCRELVRDAGVGFALEALRFAAQYLDCNERTLATMERSHAIRAITLLLESRGRYGPANEIDLELMHLAVLGRYLAAGMPRTSTRNIVGRLDQAWLTLLGLAQRGSLFERAVSVAAARKTKKDDLPPPRAHSWLCLLQDELEAEPPKIASNNEIKLSAFLDLFWELWSQTSRDDPYRDTLASKLDWAVQLGVKKRILRRFSVGKSRDQRQRHEIWHQEKIRTRVPPVLRQHARAFLSPPTLKVGDSVIRILRRNEQS